MKAVAVIFNQNQINTHPERATGRQVAAQVTSGGTSWRGRGLEISSETPSSIPWAQGSRDGAAPAAWESSSVERGSSAHGPSAVSGEADRKNGERRSQQSS